MSKVRAVAGVAAAVVVACLGLGLGLGLVGAAPAGADTASGFGFSDAQVEVGEDQPVVRIVVRRSSLPVTRSAVDFRTEGDSAVEGSDYDRASGTLVFEVGQSSSTITVLLRDDEVAEDLRERLRVVLADRGTTEVATVTILDDDLGDGRPSAFVAAPVTTVAASAASSGAGGPASVVSPGPVTRPSVVARPRPQASTSGAAVATRRRVTVRQSPVTPFELRPIGPTEVADVESAVDPLVAVAAGLLLARVAAEVWFRSRTAAA